MVITGAKIDMRPDSDNVIIPPVLALEQNDQITNSDVYGGAIEAKDSVWFVGCFIETAEMPNVLGERPPHPVPIVKDCRIFGTKLPDVYYSMCRFTQLN